MLFALPEVRDKVCKSQMQTGKGEKSPHRTSSKDTALHAHLELLQPAPVLSRIHSIITCFICQPDSYRNVEKGKRLTYTQYIYLTSNTTLDITSSLQECLDIDSRNKAYILSEKVMFWGVGALRSGLGEPERTDADS